MCEEAVRAQGVLCLVRCLRRCGSRGTPPFVYHAEPAIACTLVSPRTAHSGDLGLQARWSSPATSPGHR